MSVFYDIIFVYWNTIASFDFQCLVAMSCSLTNVTKMLPLLWKMIILLYYRHKIMSWVKQKSQLNLNHNLFKTKPDNIPDPNQLILREHS